MENKIHSLYWSVILILICTSLTPLNSSILSNPQPRIFNPTPKDQTKKNIPKQSAQTKKNTATSSTEIINPTSARMQIPVKWNATTLIDEKTDHLITNPGDSYITQQIPGSDVTVNADTYWKFNLKVNKLSEDIGDASSGVVISGATPGGDQPEIFLGYQGGNWHLGYATSAGAIFTIWATFSTLTEMEGQFQISIASNGKALEVISGSDIIYARLFLTPLFPDRSNLSSYAQIGPHTSLDISSFSIEQKVDSVPFQFQKPTPVSSIAGQTEYIIHVSPDGNDNNDGSQSSPLATITQAQQMVRQINQTMIGPIDVVIHAGTYLISSPLQFIEEDSGQNGYPITYKAAEGEIPLISGGLEVTGWHKLAGSKIWTTTLPVNTKLFRQMYVNGLHVQRAALENKITGINYAKGDYSNRDGIIVSGSDLPDLSNAADMELHWMYDWKDMRLRVSNIQNNPNGTKTIWMLQPFYGYALAMGAENHPWIPAFNVSFYVENARELIDRPGEWYYDQKTHKLYYWPNENDDMSYAQVVIPQFQTLMEVSGGVPGHEVHDLAFEGLTFGYTNWTRASEVGTYGWQAQDLLDGSENKDVMTPAHLNFSSVRNITLQANQFLHMGAAGIHLGNNTSGVLIQGNLFYDIADAAMVLGTWEDAKLLSANQIQPQNITISNNIIHSAGSEYWGAAGINAYYVAGVTIAHNEISNLPYTGISLGWGFSNNKDSTTSNNNTISNNLITDISQIGRDAGGIYTIGQMPGTVVNGNVIRRMKGDYACLYPDQGSAYITYTDNVCDSAPYWLHLWTTATHDIQFTDTFSNVSSMHNDGTDISIESFHLVNGEEWPVEAEAIMQQAGLEADYQYLKDWEKTLTASTPKNAQTFFPLVGLGGS